MANKAPDNKASAAYTDRMHALHAALTEAKVKFNLGFDEKQLEALAKANDVEVGKSAEAVDPMVAVKKMTKPALLEKCQELGIEANEDMKNDLLKEMIQEKLEADAE